MKMLILLAMVGIAFTACNKEDEPYKFKGTEPLNTEFVERPNCKYSVSEIVRNEFVQLVNSSGTRGFADGQRDTINNRLMMWADDILTIDGKLLYEFIGSTNTHLIIPNGKKDASGLLGFKWDTCGYIPQAVIDDAKIQIEALYAQEKYDEIYETFRKAFTFYTCTGEEYKAIVKEGHK